MTQIQTKFWSLSNVGGALQVKKEAEKANANKSNNAVEL
jgi:hypothetical protein